LTAIPAGLNVDVDPL